jgi:hypothetical protein
MSNKQLIGDVDTLVSEINDLNSRIRELQELANGFNIDISRDLIYVSLCAERRGLKRVLKRILDLKISKRE